MLQLYETLLLYLKYFSPFLFILFTIVTIFSLLHFSSSSSHGPSIIQQFLLFVFVDILKAALNVNLSTLTFLLQPLVQPPLTLQKTSPNICPPSPPGKPTGGHGTAALGRSTYLSPLMSSQTTSQEATCPQVWVISSLQHLDAPGVCQIPPLPGEVIFK